MKSVLKVFLLGFGISCFVLVWWQAQSKGVVNVTSTAIISLVAGIITVIARRYYNRVSSEGKNKQNKEADLKE